MSISEKEMRRALGVDRFVKAKPTSVGDSWYIKMTVRRSLGGCPEGPVIVWEETYPTISAFDAEMQARKAAKKAGFIVWVILDSHKVERFTPVRDEK